MADSKVYKAWDQSPAKSMIKCANCGAEDKHFKMFKSWRPQFMWHSPLTTAAEVMVSFHGVGPVEQAAVYQEIQAMPWKQREEMFAYKCKKICCQCELQFRLEEVQADVSGKILQEMPNYATLEAIIWEQKKDRKGENWVQRGRSHRLALQKVKEMQSGPTTRVPESRRKALVSELTQQYIQEFCGVIRRGGLFECFIKAGKRSIPNNELQAKVVIAYDQFLENPSPENLQVLEMLEDEVEQSEIYTACGGDSRLLHMVDYVNVKDTEDCFLVFDCCRAKLGDGTTCGRYMPSYYWYQPNKDRERYYCEVQWDVVVTVDPFIKKLIDKVYNNPPKEQLKHIIPPCGCGAKYVPWARGESQVVEVCISGRKPHNPSAEKWILFMADRLPAELDNEIKKVQSTGDHFIKAWAQLSDEEILSSIRKVYPRESNQIDPVRFPGVGRFPVDQWKKDGQPCLDAAGWYSLCMKLAMNDLTNLQGVFDLGKTYTERQIEAESKRARIDRDSELMPRTKF